MRFLTKKNIIQTLFEEEAYPQYHVVPHDSKEFDSIESWNKRAEYESADPDYDKIITVFLSFGEEGIEKSSNPEKYRDYKYQTGWKYVKENAGRTWQRDNFKVVD